MQELGLTEEEFYRELEIALSSETFDEVESLRDYVSPEYAYRLTEIYLSLKGWWKKELVIHLVQDELGDEFSEIMNDALFAPSADSKAYSICFREKNRALLDKYVRDHQVMTELVEKDVKNYLPGKKWWKFKG